MIAAMDVGGNPSSVHAEGRAAKALVEKARAQVARAVGADGAEIVFTSSATEAAALALHGRGLHGAAAEHGVIVVAPDTSPRGDGVADDDAYDLGQGAGFYVNATRSPWKPHFRMYDYVVNELRDIVTKGFPVLDRHGITGHSMGGHGALTIAMRNPDLFESLSAFAPIANPTQSDWGRKQLSAYLGDDEAAWSDHDATLLLEDKGWKGDILVDQGGADQFLELLKPDALAGMMTRRRQPGTFRMQKGYDHSYFFVNSFAGDHVAWHAERLH